jgi:hypothetical protein
MVDLSTIIIIIFVILIIILAMCVYLTKFADTRTISGGGKSYHRHEHHIGNSMYQLAKNALFEADRRPVIGGTRRAVRHSAREWHEYDTWKDLHNNEEATAAYFKQREQVLNNPNLDWSKVLAVVEPKLRENREYIGTVNLSADGKTLVLVNMEASPIASNSGGGLTFASIPGKLVEKYTEKPALILFHTHPLDERGSPLPSSQDLSTAIFLGAASRFAACAVISRYGVLMHGLDWAAYKAINSAADWKLATLNLSYDVVSAHEAIRSWSQFTLAEYFAFYPRHKLLSINYPSAELVGDMRRTHTWDIETEVDYNIVQEHIKDIKAHTANKRRSGDRNMLIVKSFGLD